MVWLLLVLSVITLIVWVAKRQRTSDDEDIQQPRCLCLVCQAPNYTMPGQCWYCGAEL